jgi:L,D-transpeptidase YbiS
METPENSHRSVSSAGAEPKTNGLLSETIAAKPAPSKFVRKVAIVSLALGLAAAVLTLLAAPFLREMVYAAWPDSSAPAPPHANVQKLQREIRSLERFVLNLQNRFKWLTPREPYLIVNTSANRFFLKSANKILHEGVCSTGSYVLLKASDDRQWEFVTPRGSFRILGKRVAPVWTKPDWAFVEEGLPIPPPHSPQRYEAGVLGEYALELGDGYLIHGTLYKRMLGMPVTHGCVRLGDEELRIVYRTLQLGSKVFIY